MDELRRALELATDEELQDLTDILFRPKFNPIDYLSTPDPIVVQSQSREDWLTTIEERFRFLAADGMTVLSRKTDYLSYRQVLMQVCRHLRLPYQGSMSTIDLESEIFLHLLNRALKQLPAQERGQLNVRLKRSLTQSQLLPQLPIALQHDPLSWVLKGSSAVAVSSILRPLLLQQIARQFALHFATYQVTQQAIRVGGAAVSTQLKHYVTLHMARRGMATTAASYTMARSVFAFLGPALWMWFFADLGWRSISTNYGRIIPMIYAIAQIRLTRTELPPVEWSEWEAS